MRPHFRQITSSGNGCPATPLPIEKVGTQESSALPQPEHRAALGGRDALRTGEKDVAGFFSTVRMREFFSRGSS